METCLASAVEQAESLDLVAGAPGRLEAAGLGRFLTEVDRPQP